jgi:3-oxoacyl-[acyl-carrier-protein] synthase-3
VRAGGCRRVLLCTGDVTSKLLHPADRHVRMVFGDAASASLIEAGDGGFDFAIRTDGGGGRHLHTPLAYADQACGGVGHLRMDGAEIMNFALDGVPRLIAELLAFCRIEQPAVSLIALHQANSFMLNYLRKLIGAPRDIVPINVQHYGNTGPSSIPLLLSTMDGAGRAGDNAVLCGFGVGLSLAAARLDLAATRFLPPVDVPERAAAPQPA